MKCRRTLFIVTASCLLLAGCLSTTPELPPMPVSVQCQRLPLLNDEADMGGMVLDDVSIAGLYGECARRNAGWIEWSEKARAATKAR